MLYLTCENHNQLRWLVKAIAVNRSGRYNQSRNLHFCGRVLSDAEKQQKNAQSGDTSTPYPFDTAEMIGGAIIRECPCFAEQLTVAPESVDAWQKECGPTTEQVAEVRERLTRPQVVDVLLRKLIIPASVRVDPFADIGSLFESIRQAGKVREPLEVTEDETGRMYLTHGIRRVLCAITLGLTTVPAFVKKA